MQIRAANIEDAAQACEVLRRSIVELCRADHRDDQEVLQQWLSNKTPDHVRSWIARADNCVIVATEGAAIVGVGAVTFAGEILLNYVAPDARLRGVSKAILGRLEAKARELGNEACVLTSTGTALRFYLSAGYEQQAAPTRTFGSMTSYRMSKRLEDIPVLWNRNML